MTDDAQRLPTRCADEEWCPIVATSAVLGRKWHPAILHRLSEDGPLAFGELEGGIPSISGKVLSESLTDLEEKGLVDRTVDVGKPVRVEYSLTPHGQGLEDALRELHAWGREHLVETTDAEESII